MQTYFSDAKRLFVLDSSESLGSADSLEGIYGIREKVDTDVSKKL